MLFAGTYEHTIDAKGRLAIPSELRDQFDPRRDGQAFYLAIGQGPTLCLYTERGFEQRAEELDHSQLPPEQVLEYETVLFSLARRVEPDKQGRIRLPEQLLRIADPGRDVVLVGMKDHLQIRDRETWNRQISDLLANRPELLGNPRRVIRSGQIEKGSD